MSFYRTANPRSFRSSIYRGSKGSESGFVESLPTLCWYDFSDPSTITEVSGDIDSILSKDGAGPTLGYINARPTIGTLNGLSTGNCSGSTRLESSSFFPMTDSPGYLAAFLIKLNLSSSGDNHFFSNGDPNTDSSIYDFTGEWGIRISGGNYLWGSSASGNWQVVVFSQSTNNINTCELFVDNISQGVSTTDRTITTSSGKFSIGDKNSDHPNKENTDVEFAELFVVSDNNVDVSSIYDYFASKWAI